MAQFIKIVKEGEGKDKGKVVDVGGSGRPLGVTILAILSALGILTLLFTAYLGSTTISGIVLAGVPFFTYILVLIIVNAFIVYGFLKKWRWTWWLAISLYTINIIVSLLNLINANSLIAPEANSIYADYGYNSTAAAMPIEIAHIGIYSGYLAVLALTVIYIVYLTRPNIKKWFGIK
jgi:hypothetical protein